MLQIKTFKGGYDSNLSYLLYDDHSKQAAIIDTSLLLTELLDFSEKHNLQIKFAVIMHSHFDHTISLDLYREKNIKLIASEHYPRKADLKVKDNDILELGTHKLKIISTPGHLPDCICILADNKYLFTSDTLFIDGCGRCDLAGADVEQMYNSLYKKILTLPEEIIIYPGHDYGSKTTATLKEQKKTNFYLRAKSKEEFIRLRL